MSFIAGIGVLSWASEFSERGVSCFLTLRIGGNLILSDQDTAQKVRF